MNSRNFHISICPGHRPDKARPGPVFGCPPKQGRAWARVKLFLPFLPVACFFSLCAAQLAVLRAVFCKAIRTVFFSFSRGSSVAERLTHNQEVVSSNLAPATTFISDLPACWGHGAGCVGLVDCEGRVAVFRGAQAARSLRTRRVLVQRCARPGVVANDNDFSNQYIERPFWYGPQASQQECLIFVD